MSCTILIVDDAKALVRSLEHYLGHQGYRVLCAYSCQEARIRMAESWPDIVLMDLHLPDGNGGELVRELRAEYLDTQFIVMTAFGSIRTAVEVTQRGAVDYLPKPFELEQIKLSIENALQGRLNGERLSRLRSRDDDGGEELEAFSPAMREALAHARRAAASECNVLLLGESGVGKDHLAKWLHAHSRRAPGPYFAVNCAAVSSELAESELFGHEPGAFTSARGRKRGLVELADKGTLLLNEVGELDLGLQAKLLSFLDTKTFVRVGGEHSIQIDVRILAATNRNLAEEVAAGRFRSDLYYRLNVFPIHVPPLRERQGDLPKLARTLLDTLSRELGDASCPSISPEAVAALEAYGWPGNIRELRNALERAAISCQGGEVRPEHLHLGEPRPRTLPAPADASPPPPGDWQLTLAFPESEGFHEVLKRVARALVQEALRRGRTRQDAARLLGISRHALAHQLKALGLEE